MGQDLVRHRHQGKVSARDSNLSSPPQNILASRALQLCSARARKVAGMGLDSVIAMTGNKDLKLASHYSMIDGEVQKETSLKIFLFDPCIQDCYRS